MAILVWLTGMAVADSPVHKGPIPRREILGMEDPSPAVIQRELGGWYPHPELFAVTATRERDRTMWTRSYDGVEMESPVITAHDGHYWITRFQPDLEPPPAVIRAKLIGDKAALAAAKLPPQATVKLVFEAALGHHKIGGTKGDNAENYFYVIERWFLAYRVATPQTTALVDAYTGKLLGKNDNSVR